MRMLFDTTMPVIMITPISDMTFSVVPVSSRKTSTPVMPGGIASRMMNGSMNDANCAIRIRYTSTIESSSPIPKLLNDCRMPSTEPRMVTRTLSGILVSPMTLSTRLATPPRSSDEGATYTSMTRRSW